MRVEKRGSVTGHHKTVHRLESRFKLLAPQAYVSTAAPLQTRNDRISRSAEGTEWVSKHAHTRTPTALLPYLVLHAHTKGQHHTRSPLASYHLATAVSYTDNQAQTLNRPLLCNCQHPYTVPQRARAMLAHAICP